MIRTSRRVVALAFAGAIAVAPAISACGAGHEPQSAAPTQLTEGVNASVPRDAKAPQVDIRNMFVLGPPTDQTFAAGTPVALYGILLNQVQGQQDVLTGVSSPSFTQVKLAGNGIALPAAAAGGISSPVDLAKQAAPQPTGSPSPSPTGSPTGQAGGQGQGQAAGQPGQQAPPAVVLEGLNGTLRGGEVLQITLTFQRAGSIALKVPVIPQQGEYGTYSPVPTPTTPTTQPGQSGNQSGNQGGNQSGNQGGNQSGGQGGNETASPRPSGSPSPAGSPTAE